MMNQDQSDDLTLNPETSLLIKNNAMGVESLELAFSFLTATTLTDTRQYLANHTDTVVDQYPDINTDSTVAYVQTLITSIADFTRTAFVSDCLLDADSSSATINYGIAANAKTTINIVGGDNIIGNGVLASILSSRSLYDKIRAIFLDIFLNANPVAVAIPDVFPITHLLQAMYHLEVGQYPDIDNGQLSNKFFNIDGLNGWNDITKPMATSVLLSTILGRLIQLQLPNILPAIRVTCTKTSLLLNDLTCKNEIRLADHGNDSTRYYFVFWEGVASGVRGGKKGEYRGATPVCCTGMFNLKNLEMMLALQEGLDRVYVYNWQKFDNLQNYCDFKE